MVGRRGVSLNGVRIFTLAARHLSIAKAADEAGLTPSAVSHQIKKLEGELGVALFDRSANFIQLTEAGRRLQEDASVAVAMIDRSVEAIGGTDETLCVRISASLAVRWLIPALESFRTSHPNVRVRVETVAGASVPLGACDIAIGYHRRGDDEGAGERLMGDESQPVASPALLAASGYRSPADLGSLPALRCTTGDWDWQLWADLAGIDPAGIAIRHAFDTDDAALHAAAAGLGMVLAPPLLTRREMQAGTLVPVPGFGPVELGHYRLVTRAGERRAVRRFTSWLRGEIDR